VLLIANNDLQALSDCTVAELDEARKAPLNFHVHSNAHKVIAGSFLSPDPEVT
jgi:hypothetical protein